MVRLFDKVVCTSNTFLLVRFFYKLNTYIVYSMTTLHNNSFIEYQVVARWQPGGECIYMLINQNSKQKTAY